MSKAVDEYLDGMEKILNELGARKGLTSVTLDADHQSDPKDHASALGNHAEALGARGFTVEGLEVRWTYHGPRPGHSLSDSLPE